VAEETTAAETTAAETAASETIAAKDLTVGINLYFISPFTSSMVRGAEAAGKDYGIKIDVAASENADTMQQIGLFEGQISKGVKAIVVFCVDAQSWVVPINEAVDNGAIVLGSNSGVRDSKQSAFVGISGYTDGLLLGEEIKKLAELEGKTGKVVLGNCVPGLPVLENRVKGLLESLADKPEWEIVGPLDSGLTPDATYAFWENAYNANPDMIMAIGSCSLDLPALYKLKLKYPDAKFVTIGYDLEPDALKGIQEGSHAITLGQHPYLQGYLPVMAIAEHLVNGNPLAQGWIDSGKEVITKANVDEVMERETNPEVENTWYKDYIEKNFKPIWEKAVSWDKFID
jgi:ABC-type sugar transport system substrate-binding protein